VDSLSLSQRVRTGERKDRWTHYLAGIILSMKLRVGRTPFAKMPAWGYGSRLSPGMDVEENNLLFHEPPQSRQRLCRPLDNVDRPPNPIAGECPAASRNRPVRLTHRILLIRRVQKRCLPANATSSSGLGPLEPDGAGSHCRTAVGPKEKNLLRLPR